MVEITSRILAIATGTLSKLRTVWKDGVTIKSEIHLLSMVYDIHIIVWITDMDPSVMERNIKTFETSVYRRLLQISNTADNIEDCEKQKRFGNVNRQTSTKDMLQGCGRHQETQGGSRNLAGA